MSVRCAFITRLVARRIQSHPLAPRRPDGTAAQLLPPRGKAWTDSDYSPGTVTAIHYPERQLRLDRHVGALRGEEPASGWFPVASSPRPTVQASRAGLGLKRTFSPWFEAAAVPALDPFHSRRYHDSGS